MELKHLNILSVDMELDTAKEVINHTFMYDNETVDAAFRRLFIESIDKELDDETAELSKLQPSSDYRDEKQEKRYDELREEQARKTITRETPAGGSVSPKVFEAAHAYIAEDAAKKEADGHVDDAPESAAPVISITDTPEDEHADDADRSDTYDGPDDIKDSATAEKNFDALKAALDALEENDEEGNPKWMAVVKEYTDKVDFTENEGKDVVEDEERKKVLLETLWRTTKTNILVAHTLDWEWMKNFNDPSADKETLIKNEVEDYYSLALLKAHDADSVRAPEGKESEIGTDENLQYMSEVSKSSFEKLKEFLAESRVKVGVDKIIAAASDAKVKIDEFANHLDIKGYAKSLSDKVKKYAAQFDEWMNDNHQGAWKAAKVVAESFRANKAQFISNTVATIAYGGVSALALSHGNAPLIVAATKAYASYIVGGSAVFPIIQKRHNEREMARKAGKDTSMWEGRKGIKNAIKATFSSSRNAIGYCTKVAFGVGAAALTFGIADSSIATLGVNAGLDKAANMTQMAVATRLARFKSNVARSVAQIMAQAATYVTDGIKYAFNKNEINKAYYEQSKKGLKWGAILAGGSVLLQSLVAPVHAGNANVVENIPTTGNAGNGHATLDEVLNSGRNNNSAAIVAITSGKGAAAVEAVASDNGVAAVADTAKPDTLLGRIFGKFVGKAHADSLANDSLAADSVSGNGVNVEDIDLEKDLGLNGADAEVAASAADAVQSFSAPEVPTEYSADMTISEEHWNWMKENITGIYAKHADIFDLENKSPDEAFHTMYTNVDFAKHVNPELFKDLSHVDTEVLQDMLQDSDSAALLEQALGMKADKIADLAQNNPDAIQQSFATALLSQNENKADALNDLFNKNPDLFDKQMSTEEVLYRYTQIINQTEMAKKGPNGFLITRLGKDGFPMYHTRQDETSALNSIILCGHPDGYDDFEGALSADLHRIGANGKITGEYANVGETNNTFAGARGDGTECTDTYQNAWREGPTEQPAQRPDGTASGGVWEDNINPTDGSAANGEVESNVMGGYSKDRRAGSLGVGTKTSKPVTISHDGGR